MAHEPFRSTVSILRTVLHLIDNDPTIRANSEALAEFRKAAATLIAEIHFDHGTVPASSWPTEDEVSQDSPFRQKAYR